MDAFMEFDDLGFELQPHHVVALACDVGTLNSAFSQIPRRQGRPQLRVEALPDAQTLPNDGDNALVEEDRSGHGSDHRVFL